MNKVKHIVILLFLVFEMNFVCAQDLSKVALEIMARDSIPQMTMAVVTKDSIRLEQIMGHHKIGEISEDFNANINDYFHLGSNTKAITGFIAAYLVEKGKIKWSTKFFDLFPELKSETNASYANITLEDLLTHRAHIQPFTDGEEFLKLPKFSGNKQKQRTEFAKYVLTLDPVESNESYNYSNADYSIAAIMLEKVSGKSWEKLLTHIIKKTLKIDFALGWPNRNYKNQPYGHWIENNKLVSVPPETKYDLNLVQPAGDLSMNIDNYAKFIQLNLKGLSGENIFLKSSTYTFLHTAEEDYAIGWGNVIKDGKEMSAHAGSDGTFFCYALIDRENYIGYIVMVNSGNGQKAISEIIQKMKDKYGKK